MARLRRTKSVERRMSELPTNDGIHCLVVVVTIHEDLSTHSRDPSGVLPEGLDRGPSGGQCRYGPWYERTLTLRGKLHENCSPSKPFFVSVRTRTERGLYKGRSSTGTHTKGNGTKDGI